MLSKHIEYLIKIDPFFVQFWSNLSEIKQKSFFEVCSTIQNLPVLAGNGIRKLHINAYEVTRRYFIRLPEKETEYSRIPYNQMEFAYNDKLKKKLFENAQDNIKNFLRILFQEEMILYGGIKQFPTTSKTASKKDRRRSIQDKLIDLLDIVRFRIIAKNLIALAEVGTRIWESYIDEIVKCRNFYFKPRGGPSDPYRGIHFIIEIFPHQIVEIQCISEKRDCVSRLDYHLFYKGNGGFLNKEHEKWLRGFCMKANIIDAGQLKPLYPGFFK